MKLRHNLDVEVFYMKKMAIKRELKPQAISANQQQLENPYAFFSISRENILPGIIISLYVSLILILIYFVYDFFWGDPNIFKSYVIATLLIIVILFLTLLTKAQNYKKERWDKNHEIKEKSITIKEKNNQIRDLTGNLSEIESLNKTLKTDIDNTAKKNTDLQTINEKLSEESKLLSDKIDCQQKELSILQDEKNSLEEVKGNYENQIKEIQKELKEKIKENEHLIKQVTNFEVKTTELKNLNNKLEIKNATFTDNLNDANKKIISYEARTKPKIELSKSITTRKIGRLLNRRWNNTYHLKMKNTGFAPTYDISGVITYLPKENDPFTKQININILLPDKEEDIIVGDKSTNGECSKLIIRLIHKDILGINHDLEKEIKFLND